MNLTSVYHENLRDCSTEDLMTRLECYQLDRLEVMDSPETDRTQPTMDYLEYRQNVVLEELTRRKRLISRFPDDARRPRWPDRSSERYRKQLALAGEVKQRWPIDRFCRELLACDVPRSGRERRARCPLPGHDDKTPSFFVNVDKGVAWCLGCQRGGDIFDLTGIVFGLSHFTDQLRKLGEATMTEAGRDVA